MLLAPGVAQWDWQIAIGVTRNDPDFARQLTLLDLRD
jgi:hypothetical protein